MIRTTLISASFALLGTAALAGNLEQPVVAVSMAAQMASSHDWTGFYAGGQLVAGEIDDGLSSTIDYDASGVHAGYMRDFGSFIVGGEFDYDTGETITGGGVLKITFSRLKAIAGYDLSRFMPYVTAGAANVTKSDDSEDISDTIGFYGLGASYAINDKFRVGAEYLVHDTDDFDDSGLDLDFDTLSLRASYSF